MSERAAWSTGMLLLGHVEQVSVQRAALKDVNWPSIEELLSDSMGFYNSESGGALNTTITVLLRIEYEVLCNCRFQLNRRSSSIACMPSRHPVEQPVDLLLIPCEYC